MKYKFLAYEETPSIKGQKGIVTLLYDDEIVLRFKLVFKKDSEGYFIGSGTLKGEPDNGADVWHQCVEIDRRSVKAEMESFIRSNLSKAPDASRGFGDTDNSPPF